MKKSDFQVKYVIKCEFRLALYIYIYKHMYIQILRSIAVKIYFSCVRFSLICVNFVKNT